MTPRPALVAALRALADAMESEGVGERMLPLPEVAGRLGVPETFVRRRLARELPLVRLSRETVVAREADVEAYIRRRAQLARRPLKTA
jgi:hypothetical protein